jgi:hypothetical protein
VEGNRSHWRRFVLPWIVLLLAASPASGSKYRKRSTKHRNSVASGRSSATYYGSKVRRGTPQPTPSAQVELPKTRGRPLILADTNLLVSARLGCEVSLGELQKCVTMITGTQRQEFLGVQRNKGGKKFLKKHRVMGIPHERELEGYSEYKKVFDKLKPLHGPGDAALAAAAAALLERHGSSDGRSPFEVVTGDKALIESLVRLGIPVRAVNGVRPGE